MGRPAAESPEEYGMEPSFKAQEAPKRETSSGHFVQRVYKLVPLTELEQDGYGPGGVLSNKVMPKFREVLVSERYFEGIG
jgi:hypothetical protein